jgi:hypothetical protein
MSRRPSRRCICVGDTEAIERLRADFSMEMESRFGLVHTAFGTARRDIEDLRARL